MTASADSTCQASGPNSLKYTINLCISAPQDGATVSGDVPVTVAYDTTGSSPGISKLIVYLNDSYLLMDYLPNYRFELPTAQFVDGTYTLGVQAVMRDKYITQITTVALHFNNGVETPPVNTKTFTPYTPLPVPGQPLVVAATGDAASGERPQIHEMIASWQPDMFIYLGDVYDMGTYTEFHNWYGTRFSNFGQFYDITNPTVGNHEYEFDGVASAYFYYWDNIPSFYSYDAAGWHFVVLNSNTEFDQLKPGKAQYDWLVQDLSNAASDCVIVYMHHPAARVGSSGVGTTVGRYLWPVFVNNGVDVLLTAHYHQYQRWHPMNISGNVVEAGQGPVQFVIGTGGHSISEFSTNDSRVAVGFDESPMAFGAMRFGFDPSGVNFEYINMDEVTLDSGRINCAAENPPEHTLTATHTSTATRTTSPTATRTLTVTMTPTNTSTWTPSYTPSFTPSDTATHTSTATLTTTPTATRTPTVTMTPTNTSTWTPSHTPSFTPSDTATHMSTATRTTTPTATRTPTVTMTTTGTSTWTPSHTPSFTPSNTATHTSTATRTDSPTATRTSPVTMTPTSTPTWTPSHTPSFTPSNTVTHTATATRTDSPTATRTSTATMTPTGTPTWTPGPTTTPTITQTPLITHTSTLALTLPHTPTSTSIPTSSPTLSATHIPTATMTPSLMPVPTIATFREPPSAPILLGVQPHERLADPSAIFVWVQNPVWENVLRYKLVVKDAAGQRVYVEKLRASMCEAGLCQSDLEAAGVLLANGNYTWFVQAKNSVGKTKSETRGLTIDYPGTSLLHEPVGGVRILDRSPVMTWMQVNPATQYRLRIQKNGKTVFSKWFGMSKLACDGFVCSIDLEAVGVTLPRGKLRWRIDTRNKAVSPNISKTAWGKFRIIRPSQ